ncbi:LysM peptidoglycan-binding domain-containing protein [Vibrio albus]|nr:LysM peptidoglycan-binding domain-containing protein [Vibrio albus]
MRISTRTLIPVFLVCTVLYGCTSTKKEEPVVEETNIQTQEQQMVEPEFTAQKGLTPRARLQLVMRYLSNGEPDKARVELQEYINTNPKSPRANMLMKQIDQPASSYFPASNFAVTMNKGETISTLARDYLGDVFSFYALAKYNGIEKPAWIDEGQVIKIPATPEALKHKAELIAMDQDGQAVVPEPVSGDDMLDQALDFVVEDAGMTEMMTDGAESEAMASDSDMSDMMMPEDLMNEAIDNGDYVAAVEQLEVIKATVGLSSSGDKNSISTYQQAARQLESVDPKRAAEYYYESAKVQIKYGQRESAIPSLKKAVELDPGNVSAENTLRPIQQEFADKYHSEASIAYRKQELDKAIALWHKVIEIKPDHSAAKAYLAQAEELKAKLSELQE